MLEAAACPVVQIMDIGPDPIDMMIGFSHFEGGKAAASHLLDVGCRNVGFIGARMDPRSNRRLQGYRSAMQAAGRSDDRLVTTTPMASSVSMGVKLFQDALVRMPALDAVVCNNDDIALGVLFACNRAGISVPGQIAIAGFNDLEMMAVAYPAVTSVRTPRYEIGRQAIAMAMADMAGDTVESRIVDLGFELQIRASSLR
jgi:LacI family gluconate utilization system Gnt-I transcriptional repressor